MSEKILIAKEQFKKHPFILKKLFQFDLSVLYNAEYEQFITLLKKYTKNKPVILDLQRYHNVTDLYHSLLLIFKEEKPFFYNFNLDEKEDFIKINKIYYQKTKSGNLLIYPKNFKEYQIINPINFCLSEKCFIFCSKELFCLFFPIFSSTEETYYLCFDEKHNQINNENYKKIEPELNNVNIIKKSPKLTIIEKIKIGTSTSDKILITLVILILLLGLFNTFNNLSQGL